MLDAIVQFQLNDGLMKESLRRLSNGMSLTVARSSHPSKFDSPVRTFGGRRARRAVICQVVANEVAGGRQAVKNAMYNDVNACAIVRAAP